MGSWGLLLHSITAGVYALFIQVSNCEENQNLYGMYSVQEHITKLLGLKRSYQFGLAVFAISMAVTVLSTNRWQHKDTYCPSLTFFSHSA